MVPRSTTRHPLLELIDAAQSATGRRGLSSKRCFAHLQLAGNAYVEAVALDGAVRELSRIAAGPDACRAGQ